jgi:nucleoside phosphorylase
VTDRQPAGVLVNSAPGYGSSAWIGLRVLPAPVHAGWRPVTGAQPGPPSPQEQRGWLAAQWQTAWLRRFEIRYTSDPASGLLTCTLLGAVQAAAPADAIGAAVALRDDLCRLPPGLRAEPITDANELLARLVPFTAAPGSTAEIRKPLRGASFHHLDAPPRALGVDVRPLRTDPVSWDPLWPMLTALPDPATVSIGLRPYRLPDSHLGWLRLLAKEYGRLAAAGSRQGAPNPFLNRSGADPFAAAAQQTFGEAVERYAERAFRLRVSVSSAGRLPTQVTGFLADALGGAAVQIAPPDEAAAARALRTLDHVWCETSYRQGLPEGAVQDPELSLTDLVDPAQAAAAFRLPYAPAAGPAVFAGQPQPPSAVIVVLTALKLEYLAVRELLTGHQTLRHEDGLIVEAGTLPGTGWTVAVAELGPGTMSAASATQVVRGWLRPRAVFFVGVAGGLRREMPLGDVVVATKVYAYGGGRETDQGFQARPQAWPGPEWLLQEARLALRSGDWGRPRDPAAPVPEAHFKPIAAGDVLLDGDESALARRLREHYQDAVAVEMEGSGVAHAAHLLGGLSVLIVRGISDHADGRKGAADQEGSQPRAAANAARAALAVIAALDPQAPPRGGH